MSRLAVTIDGQMFNIELDLYSKNGKTYTVRVNDQIVQVVFSEINEKQDQTLWFVIDGRPYEIVYDRNLRWLQDKNGIHPLQIREQDVLPPLTRCGNGRVTAPIPGKISKVMVAAGQRVEIAQPLLVLEAMKMENEIQAPSTGQVCAVHVSPGDNVTRGSLLVEIR